MDARLKSYCSPASDFQNNVLWYPLGTPYKNVLYLDVEFGRPRIDTFQQVNEDALKNRIITSQRQRTEMSFYLLLRSNLVDFFSTLGLNDFVELEVLETGDVYTLNNVRFEDNGEEAEVVAPIKFTFDLVAVTSTGCDQTTYELGACPP